MSDSPNKLLLVDGSNLAFRMFYALEYTRMTSPEGKPSWAIFGFFKALLDVIQKEKPTKTIAVFDAKGPTFRHEAFDYYKANRPTEMPDDLVPQWNEIQHGLELIGIGMVKYPGYEADDIIGTFALQASNKKWDTVIFSGDRDVLQLVDEQIIALMPTTKGVQRLDREGVITKMGLPPEKIIDYKALCGDSSDNIPGVRGVGDKTAIKLLTEYENLEEVYDNIENIKGPSLQKKLVTGRDDAYDSRFLATIKTDCEMAADLNELATSLKPKMTELKAFLDEYKLTSLQRKLPEIFPELAEVSEQTSLPGLEVEVEDDKSGHNKLPKISHQIIETAEELTELLAKCKKVKYLALDLETTGLDTETCEIVGWALAYNTPGGQIKAYYLPITSIDNQIILDQMKTLLSEWKGRLIIQNTKYEYKILKRLGLTLPLTALDTMLASYLDNTDQLHGLKRQSERVFGYKMTEITEIAGTKKYEDINAANIPVEKLAPYACDDAAITLALALYYFEIFDEKRLSLWMDIESPLVILLSEMELAGVKVNGEELDQLSQELKSELIQYEEAILAGLPEEFQEINIQSSYQLADALVAGGFKLTKKTRSGSYSTDMGVLEKLRDQDDTDLIQNIIQYRGLAKLQSTYVEAFSELAKSGRIHTSFNQIATSTGRLSSSDPNLQNIPVRNPRFANLIRSTFQSDQNSSLICADYSQIELRILAHYTEDSILTEAFKQGQDIHARTASEVFEVDLGDVDSDQRRLGKTLNFALLYQQGVYATAKQLEISYQEAQEFIDRYFAKFATIKPFMNKILSEAREKGYVETIWGRRRYFKNLNSNNMALMRAEERAAFNAPLQGSAADLIKLAMLEIDQRFKAELPTAQLILQVHDELIVEVPDADAEQAKVIMQEAMVLDQPLGVPLIVDIGIAKNWAEAKS